MHITSPRLLISWFLTAPFLLFFFAILLCMHPLLVASRAFGLGVFQRALSLLNVLIILALRLAGTKFQVEIQGQIPQSGPLIIVSNHQSMFDIPLFLWYLRRLRPVFVAKKELGRWIPSISFSLRNMGSILIDRKNPSHAVPMIRELGARAEREHFAVCIFPEGTRARDGVIKKFKVSGFTSLLETMPSAKILPVAVENSWILVKNQLLPIPFGITVRFTVFPAIIPHGETPADLLGSVESLIGSAIRQEITPLGLGADKGQATSPAKT